MKNITLLWLCMYCCACTCPQTTSHVPKQPVRLQMDDENADSMDLANRLALDALGFYELYEDAKWRMYCMHCDDTVKYDGLASNKTYGQLKCFLSEIRFSSLSFRPGDPLKDYIRLYFEFVYDSKREPDHSLFNIVGCIYEVKSKHFFCYLNPTQLAFTVPNCPTPDAPYRLCNPLQPEVVKYIIANQKLIDPWFYLKAKEKGVFWK